MSGPEDRQAKALEGIERYVKELTPILRAMNQNFVDFARMFQTNKADALSQLNEKLAPEGYEFDHEEVPPMAEN